MMRRQGTVDRGAATTHRLFQSTALCLKRDFARDRSIQNSYSSRSWPRRIQYEHQLARRMRRLRLRQERNDSDYASTRTPAALPEKFSCSRSGSHPKSCVTVTEKVSEVI